MLANGCICSHENVFSIQFEYSIECLERTSTKSYAWRVVWDTAEVREKPPTFLLFSSLFSEDKQLSLAAVWAVLGAAEVKLRTASSGDPDSRSARHLTCSEPRGRRQVAGTLAYRSGGHTSFGRDRQKLPAVTWSQSHGAWRSRQTEIERSKLVEKRFQVGHPNSSRLQVGRAALNLLTVFSWNQFPLKLIQR